jgi:hypothetical protein
MQAESAHPSIWILKTIAIIAPMYLRAWLFTKMNVTSGLQGALTAFLITFCIHRLPLMNAHMIVGDMAGFLLCSWTKQRA